MTASNCQMICRCIIHSLYNIAHSRVNTRRYLRFHSFNFCSSRVNLFSSLSATVLCKLLMFYGRRPRLTRTQEAQPQKRKAKEELEMESSMQRGGGSRKRKIPAAEHTTQTRNNEERSEKNESENRAANPSPVTEKAEEEEEAEIPHQRQQQQQVNNNFSNINLLAENTRQFKRFGIMGREASFAIRPLHGDINIYRALENAFREIYAYVLNTCQSGDYVGLTFYSANLAHGPAGILFRPARDLTYEDIWRVVSSVAQSAGGLDIAERFDIRVFNVSISSGRDRVKLTREDVAKRSIITINNRDDLCFPRSLVVARVYCEHDNLRMGKLHEKWNNIRHPHSSLQRELTIQLVRNAGVTITKKGCGIAEIERFQRYLAVDNIAIVVYNFATFARGAKLMYDGIATLASLEREPALRLNVMYYERLRHYNPIVNLNASAGCRNYCEPCKIGYRNDKTGHRYPSKCPRCFILPSCKQSDAEIIKCNACKRAFFGKECFKRHRSVKSYDGKSFASICNVIRFCNGCGRIVKFSMKHECGVSYCKLYQSPKPENHLCYMQPLRHVDDSSNELLTSSSTSVTVTVPSKKERVAFVFYDFETRQDKTLEGTTIVKKHIPTLCVAQQICEACAKENNLSFVFCHDPVKQFVDFATRATKCFKQIICIAHNAKAFDAQFILKYIVENRNNLEPKLILSGTKIVVLTVGHTKFIDSVNYMPMHPHLFNTVENQSYVGPLPDLHYYSPESMKTKERERFLAWHADMRQKNTVFDFQREIIRYCRTDECTTITSTCITVFRKNFLHSNTIGLIWMERELGHSINHAGRAREYRTIDGTLVDGYYETSDTTGTTQRHVLQFHECFWHGCPSCFPLNRDRAISSSDCKDTIDSRYERTLAISWRLRQRKYSVMEKWECSFDRDMRDNRKMREYLDNHPLMETSPLDPRDAFFDGRTGNIVTRYEVTDTEKIRYVDVCSLYPYVLKTGAFPIGHPDIYVGDECSTLIGKAPNYNFNTLEELIAEYSLCGKLLFALCRSYCETFSQTTCTHDNADEREFEGTWVSCELRKAVEKGYLVTAVSEIWQYKISQFDYTTRQGGLFAEYINTFLQLKQEASGWSSKCGENDDDAKEQYLREYKRTEGIVLDKRNIVRNPGLRSVAKLCLNSFWGKFGQRSNLTNTEVVRTQQRFMTLLTSAEHEITDILPVNDEIIYVSWLLSGNPNEYEPRTGNFLGDMTDELESYGSSSYIEAFVSGGPKFYVYIVRTPDGRTHESCKVKDITLNYENSLLVNFNSIRDLLLAKETENEENDEKAETSINLRFRAIRRTAFHELVTRDETKVCNPVLLKRRFISSRCSLPYGYI
ncbi:hypothetical protein ACFW04_014487 [Cataglyphis niger]